MSCRAAPWGRPSLPRGRSFPASARLRRPFGGMNLWKNPILKNSWRMGDVPAIFGLPSGLFRCMASSSSGDGGFSRSQSIDEAPMPLYPWPDKQRPRVCILGGGFGGLYTALRLESLVWPGDNKPQVMLVDQSDRFVFKPMLYELLSGEVDVWEIAPYFTELLKNTSVQFVKDSVKLLRPSDHLRREPGVSCTGGVVHLESGTVVEYDWLVLALGAEAKIDVVPGSAEYALPFTTLEHALKVESELKMLERRRFGKKSPPIQVAIVGLGYSGVELAATISERLKNTGTVKAINFQTTICPNAPPGNREAALKVLESQNIQLFLGYSVNCIREVYASEDSGSMVADAKEAGGDNKKLVLELQAAQRGLQSQVLEADLVLWTVGSQSQILRLQPPDAPYVIPLNGRGQVETEETLQVKGHPRTFAIGDSAALRDPSGKFLPANAQVAFQQADFAGWNLWAAINDRPLLPFRFQNLGEMMTLGRNDAAITANFIEGLTLEGPIGHAARKLVYCLRMPTDEHRVKVGISWFAKGAVDSLASLQTAVVRHQMEHICSSTSGKVTSMTCQSWVADKAVAMLKKDPTIGAVKILKELQDEHHVTLDYRTVWKGKQKAATNLYGSWEESFRSMYNYKAEIELRSPGSIVEIDTTTNEGEVHFSKLFIALKPCIDGFRNGCRPYISIDSTHLNGKWNGQLAVVTALDGHNWMFPVAYGFIESENGENWAWFMNQVKKAIGDPPVLAVCTDACKGLENAVKSVFPQAEQRECFRHMWHNFQKYFHGDVFGWLWPAARAYRQEEYQHHMAKVFEASEKVYPYLRDYHNLLWMRCMFNPDIKCDYINNNLAECFNAWVRDIKDLPIVQLADKIREMIMELFRKRRMLGEKFVGIILPFVIHQLNAKTRGLGHLKAKASADWSGEVSNVNKDGERHVVKTLTHECTCLQWQHTGKPCDHALAFINILQARNFVNMEDYVHEYYSVSRFRAAYEGVIEPLTDKNQWPQVDTGFVLRAPLPKGNKKGAGRTRKQRMKSWWEGGSRKGSLNKCKRCGELGHREAGCPKNGTKKRNRKGKKNTTPWFDVSVSNIVPSTPTKSKNAATSSSPGPVTRSQVASQAAATPPKSPAKGKKKKMTPKKKKLSDL